MPFFIREEKDIISSALQSLTAQTNINQLTPGSKARTLLSIVAREQANLNTQFDQNFLQAYIKYADGRFLDFFGDMFNLPRIEAKHAYADDNNVMFFVETGSFGDVNGGASFIIPAGTRITTEPFDGTIITPGLETQPVVVFQTTASVTCLPIDTFAYVPVIAISEGTEGNVSRNVLRKHYFTNYSQATRNNLYCTNRYSIDNGVSREDDESYRYRLSSLFQSRNMAVLQAIRLSALSVPGVSDVNIVNCEQGPGTFSVYVTSTTPTTSVKLLSEVSNAVNQVNALGTRAFVVAPTPLGLEFYASVKWSSRATIEDIATGYINMRNALERELTNTSVGTAIVFDRLINTLQVAAPLVSYFGKEKPGQFDAVYVYKADPLDFNKTTRSIYTGSSITPLYNERLILETSSRYRGIQFTTI